MLKSLFSNISTYAKKYDRTILLLLVIGAVLYVPSLFWGLPNNRSWIADSLAPYKPLVGLAHGFSFGYYHKYPMFHQLLLSLVNVVVLLFYLPILFVVKSFSVERFVSSFQQYEVATVLILVDRFVSLVMGCGILLLIYESTKKLFNKQSALYAFLVLLFSQMMHTYSTIAKTEIPYVFWAVFSLYMLILALETNRQKYFVLTAVFACFSFGSKDQGYAVFVLPFFLTFILLPLMNGVKKGTLIGSVFNKNNSSFYIGFLVSLIFVENLVFNFSGLLKRFELLTGDNGTRSISYTMDFQGIVKLFLDYFDTMIARGFAVYIFVFFLIGVGAAFVWWYKKRKHMVWLFLLAAVSYYIFFVQIIRQSASRFSFPFFVFISVYTGYGIYFVLNGFVKNINLRKIVVVLLFIFPAVKLVGINIALYQDVRYKLGDWVYTNIPEGTYIEYYIPKKSMLQFVNYHRFDFKEIREGFNNLGERNPDYIIAQKFSYHQDTDELENKIDDGKIEYNAKRVRNFKSPRAEFVSELFEGKYNYEVIKKIEPEKNIFNTIDHQRRCLYSYYILKRK